MKTFEPGKCRSCGHKQFTPADGHYVVCFKCYCVTPKGEETMIDTICLRCRFKFITSKDDEHPNCPKCDEESKKMVTDESERIVLDRINKEKEYEKICPYVIFPYYIDDDKIEKVLEIPCDIEERTIGNYLIGRLGFELKIYKKINGVLILAAVKYADIKDESEQARYERIKQSIEDNLSPTNKKVEQFIKIGIINKPIGSIPVIECGPPGTADVVMTCIGKTGE